MRGLIKRRMNGEVPQEDMERGAMPGAEQGGAQDMSKNGPENSMGQMDEPMMRITLAAMKVLYEQATSEGVVRMLQQKGNPVTVLAQTSLFVMKALFDESRGTMPPELVARAAPTVVKMLAELAQAAGVAVDENEAAQAEQLVTQRLQARFQGQQAPAQEPQTPVGPQPAGMMGE